MESGRSTPPTELDIESDYFDSPDSPMFMNGSYMPDTPPSPVLPVMQVEQDSSHLNAQGPNARGSGTARSAAAPDLSSGGTAFGHLGVSCTGAHEHPGLIGDAWSVAAMMHSAVAMVPPGTGHGLDGLFWCLLQPVWFTDLYSRCCQHIKRKQSGMCYIGITENPGRRWTEHQEAHAVLGRDACPRHG